MQWQETCGFCANLSGREIWICCTHLRSLKEYVLMGMRAKSPIELASGAPGLGKESMSCGERMSGDALRANSAGMVGTSGTR